MCSVLCIAFLMFLCVSKTGLGFYIRLCLPAKYQILPYALCLLPMYIFIVFTLSMYLYNCICMYLVFYGVLTK